MKKDNLKIRLNIMYCAIYGSLACYYPFLTIYFNDRGLSYSQIGVLFALNSITAVIFQPIWGVAADKYFSKKSTISFTMIISSLLIFSFMFAKSFDFILISIILFIIFQSPICSISDAYCYEIIEKKKNIQYGRVRLMGSAGYAVTALILGMVIKSAGINSSYFIYFVLTVVGIVMINGISYKGISNKNVINFSDILKIAKNKKFIIITVSAMIANIGMGANGNYLAVLIQKTGGDVSNLGMLWFIIAISELPAFFFGAGIIKKHGILNIYLLSILLYTARFLIDSFCPWYQLVLAVQLLQAVTYPLYLIATLQYVQEIVPPSTRTTAITAVTAFSGGIGGFIGNLSGGIIIERISVFFLFRLMSIICAAAFIVGLFLKSRRLNGKMEESN